MPTVTVLDSTVAYRAHGSGAAPLVFLHGNPTSSYIWREVLPRMGSASRSLAPELIGMGESGKPAIDYSFDDHARYLEGWIDALGLDDLVLVGHDWGGALALDLAARHPDRVRGIALLETILRPMTWDEFPASARDPFAAIRTPEVGEQLVLEENLFLEQALPGTVAGLSDAALAAYRAPYPTAESRRPLLQWPRAMPIDGEPADVVARVEAYGAWLESSPETPKLLLAFDPGPGIMVGPDAVEWCRRHVSALEVAECGPAGHHAPEERPEVIAAAVSRWLDRHGLRSVADPSRG